MVQQLQVVRTANANPYRNLAVEKHLLDHVQPGQCVLYLWRNANTVVIGRNQNAQQEVRLEQLRKAGGRLARRLSGGGAVYHDLGNLNFTFVAQRPDYDPDQQTQVIVEALRMLGVEAERTGRNDLLAGGRKFSGHAYYRTAGACLHHGTLMVDVDLANMERFLQPAPAKLAAKGVASVHARVANLSQLRPGVTVGVLAEALEAAFGKVYRLPCEQLDASELDKANIQELAQRFASREWLFRKQLDEGQSASARFDWGGVTLRWREEQGHIGACSLSSDGLEADFLAELPEALTGCELAPGAVEQTLEAHAHTSAQREQAHDIAALLLA